MLYFNKYESSNTKVTSEMCQQMSANELEASVAPCNFSISEAGRDIQRIILQSLFYIMMSSKFISVIAEKFK